MLYNTGVNICQRINPFKINVNKECTICNHYFCNHGFNFQYFVCNGCYGLTHFCLHISDIATAAVKNVDYHCIIYKVRKSNPINPYCQGVQMDPMKSFVFNSKSTSSVANLESVSENINNYGPLLLG